MEGKDFSALVGETIEAVTLTEEDGLDDKLTISCESGREFTISGVWHNNDTGGLWFYK